MVDPLSYFLLQPGLHNWCNKDWYVLSSLLDGAYKRSLAVNWKEFPHKVVAVGFLSRYLSDPYHISDAT